LTTGNSLERAEFIEQKERNPKVHYVSFFDGIYFNKFINLFKGYKHYKQNKRIECALRKQRANFLFNSSGFESLLADLVDS